MTEPVPVPVLNDGGDWWMLIEVGYTDSPDPVLNYCKVLQWERTVDTHGEPMIAAWLVLRVVNSFTGVRVEELPYAYFGVGSR